MNRFVVITSLVLLLSFPARAQSNFPPAYSIVSDTISTLTLPDSCWQWLEDETGQATIAMVRQLPLAAQFRSFTPESRRQNSILLNYWIRFRLKNTLNRPIQVALQFPAGLRTDLYLLAPGGGTKHFKSGLLVPWSQRDGYNKRMVYGNDFVLVRLPAKDKIHIIQKSVTLFGGMKASHIGVSLFSVPFVANTLRKNNEEAYYGVIGLSFHLGVMVWVALLNLLFFSIVRERIYVYFAFYVLTLGLAGFDYNQHLFHLFFREYPQLYYLISPLYFGLIPFFLVLFIQHLFQVGAYFPRWNRVLSISNVTAVGIWFIYYLGIRFFATPQWNYYANSLPVESSVFIYYLLLITVVLYLKSPQQLIRNRATVILLFYGTWIVLWSTLQHVQQFNRLFNTPLPAFHASLLVVWPTIEMIYLYALVFYFIWILLQRFSELRKQVLQKELEKEVERNQLMAQQNETLEKKVTERTAQLQHSLDTLRATQTQLIQKEKMASLGELTAGIAHEIQNPLNFVNNFAEVSAEMAEELEQNTDNADMAAIRELSAGLKENMGYIVENGKRAAGIVRAMLEHSRSGSGERRPTNLNELADEYLKLAYLGIRSQDPDFQAQLITDFDDTLPAVEVAPQEIGRVLLNLYNNAFYAVREKERAMVPAGAPDSTLYQPTVWVSTRQVNGSVELSVKDNGTGIPEGIISKIYQPFFTTKPTGQGTGLGLSLSYDIVTKGHGGEMRVESREGEGTAFQVQLPITHG